MSLTRSNLFQLHVPRSSAGNLPNIMTALQPRKTRHIPYTTATTTEIHRHMPDGFILLDRVGRIIEMNPRAEQILCCTAPQVMHRLLWEALPALTLANGENVCRYALEHQTEIHFEQTYEPYGLLLEVVASPHQGGLFLYLRDVTLYRQASTSLQEHTRLASLSNTLSEVLAGTAPLPEMLHQCLDLLLAELPELKLAQVWIFDPESNFLTVQAIAHTVPEPPRLPQRVPLGLTIVGVVAQNRVPYRTNQVHRDRCLELQQWSEHCDFQSFVGYPLVVDNRLVGVITLFGLTPICEHTYTALQWMFNGMAIAIDRSMARAELMSRRESLLFRLASQIRKSLDLNTILAIAVQEIRQLFSIDSCHFLWCLMGNDSQTEVLPTLAITHEASHPDLPSLLGEHAPELGQSLIQRILRQEPLKLEDTTQEQVQESSLRAWIEDLGIQSFLLLPLETHSGQLGAIACSHREARPWTQTEMELLYAVADQLAIAIDQAELYAQSRAAAFAAQAQAQQLNQTLQTLRQTQAQMVQNEKMSSLGQLVAGIAHEINNPVGFVSGNLSHAEHYFHDLVELLQRYQTHYPNPVPEIQEYIEDIDLEFVLEDYENLLNSMKMGTERITKIVLSLRNFSRLDEAAVKAVDLHQGLDSTLLILHNRLKARGTSPGIEVIKNYGDLPPVSCYASQLNQVFLNILSNAIDALQDRPEPRQITIKTYLESRSEETNACPIDPAQATSEPPAKTWVVVRIRDNGAGMPEQIRAKIFDPFFTTKPVGQGTGLGLSISHQIIVEKHHGHLSCSSSPDAGTEFLIEIPLNDLDA